MSAKAGKTTVCITIPIEANQRLRFYAVENNKKISQIMTEFIMTLPVKVLDEVPVEK